MSRFKLPQKITYWIPTGNNGTGGKTWGLGIVIPARIANVNETVFTAEGKEQQATKSVYSKTFIPLGSYVIEAEHSGVTEPVSTAQLVINSVTNTTMTDMFKVML